VGRDYAMWATITVKQKMRPTSERNPGPHHTGISGPHPMESPAHIDRNTQYAVYVMRKGLSHADKRSYCCANSPRCADWYLHKFRHTFATNMLQSVDIRNLQVLLGHKNISTTEKYLKTMRLEQLREKVENSSLTDYL
jgi:integrase